MHKKWVASALFLLLACTDVKPKKQAFTKPSSKAQIVQQPIVEEEPKQVDRNEVPLEWLSERMRCSKKAGRKFCDGPRRIVAPYGSENDLANLLGLGTFACAAALLRGRPNEHWSVAGALPAQLYWPIEGGRFGRGLSNKPIHRGVDITAESGTPVHLVADGLVAYANNEVSGYGNLLVVIHAEGAVSAYAHLSEIRVFPGQRRRSGEVVALTGNTGLSRGPHLHFEWRQSGKSTDPMSRFSPIHRRGNR